MQKIINIDNKDVITEFFGSLNQNAKLLEKKFELSISMVPQGLILEGMSEGNIVIVQMIIERLLKLRQNGIEITGQLVNYLANQAATGAIKNLQEFSPNCLCITAKGRPIQSKTEGQNTYIKAMQKKDLVFAVGPAGTGKTFLAVAMAVRAFREHQVDRIILTRPAVEAGEKLGFLPGDLQMKVDPYMRPLYDALHELMGYEQYSKYMEKSLIEVSPLAYMRGRTLDNAFIILDEAQNTTVEQMKMFLTRIGFNSKVVVTGDVTQIDLPSGVTSGLVNAKKVLKSVEAISFVNLDVSDVVRNPIVQDIINAYDKWNKNKK